MTAKQYVNVYVELKEKVEFTYEDLEKIGEKMLKLLDDCLTSNGDCEDVNISSSPAKGLTDSITFEFEYVFDVYSRDIVEYDEYGYRCTNETEHDYIDGVYEVNQGEFEKKLEEADLLPIDWEEGIWVEICKVDYGDY